MRPEINITPLIDVLLVLLIIFMVISPLEPKRFEARIPNKIEGSAPASPLTLIVKVNRDSTIELNGTPGMGTVENPASLTEKLSKVFSERTKNGVTNVDLELNPSLSPDEIIQKTVFIKAPKMVPYGNVVKLIDAIKVVGANPISLQIDDLE
ncbi:MAG: biopolymer transporter ExbD [Pyrinomonadaceae bacterium]